MSYEDKIEDEDEFAKNDERGQGKGDPLEKQISMHMADMSGIHGVSKNDYCPVEIDVHAVSELDTVNLHFITSCRDFRSTPVSDDEIWRTVSICQRLTQDHENDLYYPGIAFTDEGLTKKAEFLAREYALLQIKPHHWGSRILGQIEYHDQYPDYFRRLLELSPHFEYRIPKTEFQREHPHRTRKPMVVKIDGINPMMCDFDIKLFESAD